MDFTKYSGQWATRGGTRARVYTEDGQEPYIIHGAVQVGEGQWAITQWDRTGKNKDNGDYDMVVADQEMMIQGWINIYHRGDLWGQCYIHGPWPSKYLAQINCNQNHNMSIDNWIACVPICIMAKPNEGKTRGQDDSQHDTATRKMARPNIVTE